MATTHTTMARAGETAWTPRGWSLCALLLIAGITACGDKGGDDSGGSSDGGGAYGGAFSPQEGHWTTTSNSFPKDSCGFTGASDGGAGEDGFTLTQVAELTFEVQFDTPDEDGWDLLTCTLSEMDWACAQNTATNDLTGDGVDAVLSSSQDVAGSFLSATSLTGGATVNVDCSGDDCDIMASVLGLDSFPCQVISEFAAEADAG